MSVSVCLFQMMHTLTGESALLYNNIILLYYYLIILLLLLVYIVIGERAKRARHYQG